MLALPLVGDGVVVDRLVPGDAAALARSHSDPDNARHQGWKTPLSEQEAARFIADQLEIEPLAPGTGLQLAIRERTGEPLAGDLYLARGGDPADTVEVGITLVPGFGGRGLATAAIAATVGAAARVAGIERVVAWVHHENARSRALFERLGFRIAERGDGEVRYEMTVGECRVGRHR